MSVRAIQLDEALLNALLDDIASSLESVVSSLPSELRSDLDMRTLALGALLSFLASVGANQLPTLPDAFAEPRPTRADVQRVYAQLKGLRIQAEFAAHREPAVRAIEARLPPAMENKAAVAARVFKAIETTIAGVE